MVGERVMNVNEQVIGSMADAYVVIDGQRYQLFNLQSFTSDIKVTMKEKGLLGRTGKVSYPTGWKGTWKATISYNFPVFRQLLYKFKNTGVFPSIEIVTTNENTTGTIGRQTVTHKGCYIDSAVLSKIDVGAEDELTEDISGTFNDFELPEEFGVMNGMTE